jgi:hypothetical protein
VTVFSLPSTVRHADVDGLRVVLDLRSERYRVLDDIASVLWTVLVGDTRAVDAFDALAGRYDVDGDRLQADLAAFADRCIADGLLVRAVPPTAVDSFAPQHPRARGGRPSTLRAFASLLATNRALARDGFRATYERYALLPVGPAPRSPAGALATFVRAENLFVTRRAPDDCLMRSLSLYRYLRSLDVPCEHVIAARRFPFSAHAWVECDGTPLLDETACGFTPLARIGGAARSHAVAR